MKVRKKAAQKKRVLKKKKGNQGRPSSKEFNLERSVFPWVIKIRGIKIQ